MRILLLCSLACGGELKLDHVTEGCVNVDFDDTEPGAVKLIEEGVQVQVFHTNIWKPTDSVYAPEVETEGKTVHLYEIWEEGEDDDFCYQPTLIFKDPPKGNWEVRWYVEGSETPIDTLTFKAD